MNQITCACFDLETTNLSADFGVILCGVIKPAEGDPIVFRADHLNGKWSNRRSDDSKVVKAIITELSNYDIWIAHNGARFDVPFLRTRAARWGLSALPTKKLLDPVLLARNKLRMSFNSLKALGTFLGCDSKTDVDPEMWLRASLDGDRKAMTYIVEHCVEDVLSLERIVGKLKDYCSNLNSYGSGY